VQRRWTILGVACIALLCGALVLLPLALAPLPRLPQTATRPASPEPPPREAPAPTLPDTRPAPRPQTEPPRTPAPAQPSTAPATRPAPPVIERSWTRTGSETSTQPARIATDPPVHDPEDLRDERSAAGREQRVARFGGTRQTEDAVESGLKWLAAHQEADGRWSRTEFFLNCPRDDRCSGPALRRMDSSLDAGLTGLALLAFLGAGYTDRDGPYPLVVGGAVNYLLRVQGPHGGFAADREMAGYNDSLATFALAEYYALTRDPRVRAPLERAVERLLGSQQAAGGWDYLPTPESGRNDTSISAWVVQALAACASAGIDVPRHVFARAALHFTRATEPDGRVWYADTGTGVQQGDDPMLPELRYGPAMTAAGLTCSQLLGWRADSGLTLKLRGQLSGQAPSAAILRGRDPTQLHSYYYWYYGTVAAFQVGGETWERWNARLRDALLPLQDRTLRGESRTHSYGSWQPYGVGWGKWGRMGGRVYTTAICVLTLEIYYRHTPAYLRDDVLLSAADWRRFLDDGMTDAQRELVIRNLAESRFEVGEPILVELLRGPHGVRAARALVELDSPIGLPVLDQAADALPEFSRRAIDAVRRRARALGELPAVHGEVRLFDPEQKLATATMSRTYVGMPLTVERQGRPIGRMIVVRRFSGRDVAVAELLSGDAPQPGDAVVGR